MNIRLEGKKALVTGSTAGIGYAIAKALAESGAEVILNGRTESRVKSALEKLKSEVAGAKLVGVSADLGTSKGAAEMIRQVPQVDILVNNLGIFEPKPFLEIPDEDWMRFFEVNVMSGVRLARHYVPGMVSKKWGRIVFISSESAIQIPPEMVHYGMTKTAQLAVARGLAESLVGTGVTVNSVLPGPTRSEGVGDFVGSLAKQQGKTLEEVEHEFFQKMRPTSLLQRFIEPKEVASLVTYVVSNEASAVTGASLRADGGVARSIL